jgi:hypothetical protein
MARSDDTYVIQMDGRWTLEDLYVFPRSYEQVYFLTYSLFHDLSDNQIERIQHAYESFPWRGGYSAVNFYNQLKYSVPRQERPKILSIRYESPGWIELAVIAGIAISVASIVKAVAASIQDINATYNQIIRGLRERKLMQIEIEEAELRLRTSEVKFIEECADAMAHALGFTNIKQLNKRTGHPYRTLKILLSLYRRIRTLAEYQNKGKVDLPEQIEKEKS